MSQTAFDLLLDKGHPIEPWVFQDHAALLASTELARGAHKGHFKIGPWVVIGLRTAMPTRTTLGLAMSQIGWPLGKRGLAVVLFGMATLNSFHNKALRGNNNWAPFSMTLPGFGVAIDTLQAEVEVRFVQVLWVFEEEI